MSGGMETIIFRPKKKVQKGGQAHVETVSIPILWCRNELMLMSGPKAILFRPLRWLKKPRQATKRLFTDWWIIFNRRFIE